MGKKNFDLDMIDEYPDALGSKNTQQREQPIKKMESIEPKLESHTTYEGIAFSDFEKVDLRVGKIVDVSDVPGAKKPLWKLRVDIGDAGMRTIVARIKDFYTSEELIDRQIIVVVNLKPRSLAGIMSEGMLLAAEDDSGNVSLVSPDKSVEPGCKIR